jgi:hypothetical protein
MHTTIIFTTELAGNLRWEGSPFIRKAVVEKDKSCPFVFGCCRSPCDWTMMAVLPLAHHSYLIIKQPFHLVLALTPPLRQCLAIHLHAARLTLAFLTKSAAGHHWQ